MPMQYSKKQKQKSKDAKKEQKKEEMKKEKKESPRYQKNEPVRENEGNDADRDEFSDDEESGVPNKADGLADMMAKILNQNTGNKIPVLAKRKTSNMKDIEEDRANQLKIKKARIERRAEQTKQLVVPDMQTADYERQLKKLATRGVVALFNAIAEAKRNSTEEENAKENAKKAARDASNPSKNNKQKSDKKSASKQSKNNNEDDDDDDDSFNGEKKQPKKNKTLSSSTTLNTSSKAEPVKTSWKALKDDYMMEKSLSLKNWDKQSSDGSDNDN